MNYIRQLNMVATMLWKIKLVSEINDSKYKIPNNFPIVVIRVDNFNRSLIHREQENLRQILNFFISGNCNYQDWFHFLSWTGNYNQIKSPKSWGK